MEVFLTYTCFGLVLGGAFGIAAAGLVVTYNTSGVLNFAHGAEAMLGAFLYWQLRYQWGWSTPLAVVVVLGVFAPLMGWLLYTLAMRHLRDTTEVTKVVVTVAILLGMLALSRWVWDPTKPRTTSLFFGDGNFVTVLGVHIPYHYLLTLAVTALVVGGLAALFRWTRIGVAMRGVVDDPDLLQLNGHNPDRTASLGWVLGAMLAVLAGMLITPISGGALEAQALTLIVIQAFAAAMFGRLHNLPRTFLGAIVLGLTVNYAVAYLPSDTSWTSGFRVSLPMIILFLVLLKLPPLRLSATQLRTRERYNVPSVRKAAIGGVLLVAAAVLLRLLMVPADVQVLTLGIAFATVALSVTLLTGYAGQMSLAPLSFAAISVLVTFHFGVVGHGLAARTTWWGIVLGVLAAALVGGVVALPALRLQGLYLALATMAFAIILTNLVLLNTTQNQLPLLHTHFDLFPNGTLTMPPLKVGPLDLADNTTALVVITMLFALLGLLLVAVRNSGYGRRLAAMKDSAAASATLGESLFGLKLTVFMISAAIAGLGGVLIATTLGAATSDNFSIFVSLSLVMMVVVGGIGYVSGALLGGLLAGIGFTLLIGTMNNLAVEHPAYHGLFSTFAQIIAVSAGLIGVVVARSPSGFVHGLTQGYRGMERAVPTLVGAAVVGVGLYIAALTRVLPNWWFAILVYAIVMLLPVVHGLIRNTLDAASANDAIAAHVPLDLVGVDTPFSSDVLESIDRQLGLDANGHGPGSFARPLAAKDAR
jgi:branched-chain amino acid transport system permease protein